MNFKDRVALVTGSGRGLGAATVKKLASLGANVVVNDISQETAESCAKEIEKLGVKTLASTHDVSQKDQASELMGQIKESLGRLDILVNNAGILRDSMLHKLSEKDWDDVIRVNLKGPFNVTQAAVPFFKEQNSGRILNLASVAWMGNVGQTNYSAAKAGLVGLTRTWALELSRFGVTVNAIAPGLIKTDMTDQIPPEIKEKLVKSVPLKRMGESEEIADLISFLVSDQAAYISGQCIHIDGGLTTGLRLG